VKLTEWRTQKGEWLKISEMKTSHIENCIKYLEENPIVYSASYDLFGNDHDICFDDTKTDAYIAAFEKELQKRGVK